MCAFILIAGMIGVSAYALLQIMAGGGSLAWMCLPTLYFLFLLVLYLAMQKKQSSIVVVEDDPDTVDAEVIGESSNNSQSDTQFRMMHMLFLSRLWKFQIFLLKGLGVIFVLWAILKIVELYMQYSY